MSASRDLVMSEGGDAVRRLRAMVNFGALLMGIAGVLHALTGTLLPGQVILLPMLFTGGSMGVRGKVVQFGRALVIFVMRSVVITCGHKLKTPDLPGLRVGFLRKLVCTFGVLERTLGMPVSGGVVPFFVMLRGGTVVLRR
jgi:hypothetical protein